MRKMIQSKGLFVAVGLAAMSAVVGFAGANPLPPSQPATTQRPATSDATSSSSVDTPVPRVETAENTVVNRNDRMICKQEILLGTRLKGLRTCRTASEWRRVARGFQSRLKETNDKAAAAYSGN
jgi:hypothetical protein